MLSNTLNRIACPKPHCKSPIQLLAPTLKSGDKEAVEIQQGTLQCVKCKSKFPILMGVALLVDDLDSYFQNHVKGISALVKDADIPKPYFNDYAAAREEIQSEHIEEDLESERVTALYIANHYLHVKDSEHPWWKPKQGTFSPHIDSLIRENWDHGPFQQIQKWISHRKNLDIVELGCGVGGLATVLKSSSKTFLGVDSSFASIAIARHLTLGTPYPHKLRIPEDLYNGPLTNELKLKTPTSFDGTTDFIVGELENAPIKDHAFDLSIVLNAIDMLESPEELPQIQMKSLKPGAFAIQTCPYIWHEVVLKELRKLIPKTIRDSARAVEFLYEKVGFKIEVKLDHVPWLFFKHARQIELYSVHMFIAKN